jgi:hypothetical protein
MKIPQVITRRPLDDLNPDHYLESDRDWVENNWAYVMWAMENEQLIRSNLNKPIKPKNTLAPQISSWESGSVTPR